MLRQLKMENLLSEIDEHWARTLLELHERNPLLLEPIFDELNDNEKADLEMSKLVKDPLDPRIVDVAKKNNLIMTLRKIDSIDTKE